MCVERMNIIRDNVLLVNYSDIYDLEMLWNMGAIIFMYFYFIGKWFFYFIIEIVLSCFWFKVSFYKVCYCILFNKFLGNKFIFYSWLFDGDLYFLF